MANNEPPEASGLELKGSKALLLHRNLESERLTTLDQRTGRDIFSPASGAEQKSPSQMWDRLWTSRIDNDAVKGFGLYTDPLTSAVAGHFDLLRARLLLLASANRWSRIAITSPTPGNGKSFVAANLALSLSRLPACRTILVDLDLRSPSQSRLFGLPEFPPLANFLLGQEPIERQVCRMGPNLGVALNGQAVPRSYEILQDPSAMTTLNELQRQLQPDVTLFDMPPAFESDDVLAMAPNLDAILLVVDGTATSPDDIRRCTMMFEGHIPLAGVVLNKALDRGTGRLRRRPRRFGGR
jgi:protein-tyrosine kinase